MVVKRTEATQPLPEGFHTVTPHIVVHDAEAAIHFYKKAFGAELRNIHKAKDGKVISAELKIGDSIILLADELPGRTCVSPQSLGKTTAMMHIYTSEIDDLWNQAVAAGAKVALPLTETYWGDRAGQLVDPFGQRWSLAAHIQDLSPEEIDRAGQEFYEEMAKFRPML